MSDFLSRLAARAMGQVPVAEPVIGPRFGAPAGGAPVDGPADPGGPADAFEGIEELEGRGLAGTEAPVRREPRPSRAGAPSGAEPESVPAFVDRAARDRTLPSSQGALPPSMVSPEQPRLTPNAAPMVIDAEGPSTLSVPGSRRDPILPVSPTLPVPPRAGREPAQSTLEPLQAWPERAALGQERSAPPTIRITIGRIEVRAQAAPPAPPRERKAPTVMPLEQYLQERSKGGPR